MKYVTGAKRDYMAWFNLHGIYMELEADTKYMPTAFSEAIPWPIEKFCLYTKDGEHFISDEEAEFLYSEICTRRALGG